MTTQIEKFNARAGKAIADKVVEDKAVVATIVQEMKTKKSMYQTIDILSNSVRIQSQTIISLELQLAEQKTVLDRIDKATQLMVPIISPFDIITGHYLDMHRRGAFVTNNEMIMLGVDRYALIQHKDRAVQIKETGTFVDVIPSSGVKTVAELGETITSEVIGSSLFDEDMNIATGIWEMKWKRGPRGAVVSAAYMHVNSNLNPSGRISWPKDKESIKALIKSFLVLAQYEGIEPLKSQEVEKSRYKRVHIKIYKSFDSYKIVKEMF